jgi:hypothetical protein
MTRPSTVTAVLVVALLNALLQLTRTVASGIALTAFVLTHPGSGSTRTVVLSGAVDAVVGLVLVTGSVLLVLRFWRAAPRARAVLAGWLALSGLLALGGVVTLLTAVADPGVVLVALPILQVVLCAAALVLLWRPATSAWLRSRSVGPARPGL